MIQERLGDSRLFTIGIGSAPNSHFMRRAADLGRGTFTYIGKIEEVEQMMAGLFRKLEQPAVTDVHVRVDNGVADMLPARVPDLYAGEPAIVAWRSTDEPGRITVDGRLGELPWRVEPNQSATSRAGIAVYWARQMIESLSRADAGTEETESMRREIIDVALRHHLVSPYTSLVAVEQRPVRPADQGLRSSAMPTNLPHGWDYDHVFGSRTATPAPAHLVIGTMSLMLAVLLMVACRARAA
jgi:Ca-activated chloride channel family protein